jgi:uncharacterized protein (TIGR02391 family)
MRDSLSLFEEIVRRAYQFTDREEVVAPTAHPFEQRNISDQLPKKVRTLFDDAHYAQATFEAFKFLDKEVQRHSGLAESGFKLMMSAFGGDKAGIRLTPLSSVSEQDEQKGYQFLFAGGILAIRNPRGHEYAIEDDPETCLDHLGLISMLIRRLSEAGYTP